MSERKKKNPESQSQKVLNKIRLLYVKQGLQVTETQVSERIEEAKASGIGSDQRYWEGYLAGLKISRGFLREAMNADVDDIMKTLAE